MIGEIVELQREASRTLGAHAGSLLVKSGLTIAQLKNLLLIADMGSTNFRKLAEALGVTPSNVTGIVDRLVEQGLVSREENPEDRRVMTLQATDSGRALLSGLKESGIKHMTRILSSLSLEELAALAKGLSALVRAANAFKGEISDDHD